MHTTPASLLERLREPTQAANWERFVQLYARLLYYWARRVCSSDQDAADLVQEVFATLVQKLPAFHYNQDKGFRNWLRTVLLNKWREHRRRVTAVPGQLDSGLLDELASPDDVPVFDEIEYRQHLVRRALELMQSEFSPKMWKACWEHVALGRSAEDVATELGISVGAVYVAKSRILARLRQELQGLLD